MLYMMYVTFFNKSLMDQYSLENPYDLVEKNDIPGISPLFGREKTQDLVTKICAAYYKTEDYLYNNDAKAALESYGAGKGIFIVERLRLSLG